MTEDAPGSDVEDEEAPPAPFREPPTPAARPLWTYFLLPAAVIAGSLLISGTIWYTRDDGASTPVAVALPAATVESAPAAPTAAGESKLPATDQTLKTVFFGYAKQLGLDSAKFQQCLLKKDTVTLINRQLQRGQALGVDGTPTFFINNKKVVGAQPAAVFEEVINAELKGSPATLDGYSDTIKKLAASQRFEIMESKPDISDASIEGSPNAKVVIVEFSDFQCPFCKKWTDENLRRIRTQLGNDVALVFEHFPIVQIHPNAGDASAVAVCAGEQGKFWQMHDLLFKTQSEWQGLKSN
jgi:protein-disulfide isomerase